MANIFPIVAVSVPATSLALIDYKSVKLAETAKFLLIKPAFIIDKLFFIR